MSWLYIAYWMACAVVLAEALNKVERADLFDGRNGLQRFCAMRWLAMPWRWRRDRVVAAFKVSGWVCLALGAFGGLIAPLFAAHQPSPPDVAIVGGFALLIIRSRIKEGCT
jgi:hypothetical protein